MVIDLFLALILIVICIFLTSILSTFEKTVAAIRPSYLRESAAGKTRRAEYLRRLRADPERFFHFIRFFIIFPSVLASLLAGILTWFYFLPYINNNMGLRISPIIEIILVLLVVSALTIIIIMATEFCPRLISRDRRNTFALWVSVPVWYALRLLSPIIAVIDWLAGIPIKAGRGVSVGEKEIRLIFREGLERGVLTEQERKILYSLFEFTDTMARRAMTPRTDIVAIEINSPVETILKIATEERFSRYPVYEENIDNIKGLIHSRDLLYVFTHGELFVFKDIIKQVHFVPDSKPISQLMREMKKDKFHMAIVLDEFGGTSGIITMEDIVEEIIGDIQDEYDKETSKIIFIDTSRAMVKASMPVDEFANEFGVEIAEGEFDTVGGMVVTRLGRIPSKGEKIKFDNYSLEIGEKDGHRIKSLIARKSGESE